MRKPRLEQEQPSAVPPKLPVGSEPFEWGCNPIVHEPELVPFDHEEATKRVPVSMEVATADSVLGR